MTQSYSLTRKDLLSLEEFSKKREAWRKDIIALKKKRRIPVGPDITFYFENRQTILWQIQEMLYIEKGGEEQIDDELKAYNPLIPQGNELVATMMIEIEDIERRRVTLAQLGHIEYEITLEYDDVVIKAEPTEDLERTTGDGKTSSVHFLHFSFTPDQRESFKTAQKVLLCVNHSRYNYKAALPRDVHAELSQDL